VLNEDTRGTVSPGRWSAAHIRRTRVLVAHNPAGDADDPSTRDVLAQVELVGAGLTALGLDWSAAAASRRHVWRGLPATPGLLVFNLVEAPPGDPAVHPGMAAVLELLDLPFTGSPAAVLWLTTDKLATRALLAAEGLPVAAGGGLDLDEPAVLDRVPPPWILKPACEDASLGLESGAVVADRAAALARAADLARRFPGQRLLVERYLPGRELNVSLLAAGGGLEALPVAEIVFESWPDEMPRIVGYEAKWQPESFAYRHTERRFPAAPADAELMARARRLTLDAARVCGLRGYGRVDLRLDEHGEPHILEVNANPCLAADAGFMAAAAAAGLTAGAVVGRILEAAMADHAARRRPAARRASTVGRRRSGFGLLDSQPAGDAGGELGGLHGAALPGLDAGAERQVDGAHLGMGREIAVHAEHPRRKRVGGGRR
jgi:D-alanine-D-alanine ligase